MEPARRIFVTEQEYLERERKSETKNEYLNGEIVAMAGGSYSHNLLAANVIRAIGEKLDGKPCRVLASDQRVHVPTTRLFTYPDVSVVCGRPEFHPEDSSTLMNPVVIVEVLSDSTEAYDRGGKFAHYRRLPSLAEYLLVWQSERRVEHYRRMETGQWLLTEYQDDASAALSALGIDVSLAKIYQGVELPVETGT